MNESIGRPHNEPARWLDDARNVRKVYFSLWVVGALVLIAELFVAKHGDSAIEHVFGFHGFFGLVACLALVFGANLVRRFLRRPEDYYYDRR